MNTYARWIILSVVLLAVAYLVALLPNMQSWVAPVVGVVVAQLVSIWLPRSDVVGVK